MTLPFNVPLFCADAMDIANRSRRIPGWYIAFGVLQFLEVGRAEADLNSLEGWRCRVTPSCSSQKTSSQSNCAESNVQCYKAAHHISRTIKSRGM
jgi:hypothetical protein